MKPSYSKRRFQLWFILAVATILICAVGIILGLGSIIIKSQIVSEEQVVKPGIWWIILIAVSSMIIGVAIAFLFSKLFFKPLDTLIDSMKKLSEGDFSIRITPGRYENFKSIAKTFNTLASELENTEILRSDFVNDFSHEIKTPINSLNGLIGLLSKKNLSKEKQKEYLAVIEKEINRLSSMTTNILNLSKIEKQGILTDKTWFNLSEQIRTCILLSEKSWTEKKLTLSLDFDEFNVYASEDILRQVWINLIDNAIKYSDEKGELKISINKTNNKTVVSVENTGEAIMESDYDKIFTKFYQGESKREKQGNGIGLSIVKRIIDLHNGNISVKSQNGKTVFTVILP